MWGDSEPVSENMLNHDIEKTCLQKIEKFAQAIE